MDFDLVLSAGTERALLSLTGRVACLYQRYPVLPVDEIGTLPLTELTPLGGLRRVNLSNLRQASGRLRIEACPVGDESALQSQSGHLVSSVTIVVGLGGKT